MQINNNNDDAVILIKVQQGSSALSQYCIRLSGEFVVEVNFDPETVICSSVS